MFFEENMSKSTIIAIAIVFVLIFSMHWWNCFKFMCKAMYHYVLWTTNVVQFSETLFFIIQVFLGMSLGLLDPIKLASWNVECTLFRFWGPLNFGQERPKVSKNCPKSPKIAKILVVWLWLPQIGGETLVKVVIGHGTSHMD